MATNATGGAVPRRSTAIDSTRGIAILLVAVFHMTRAQVTAHALSPTYALRFADSISYGVAVQIFFVVSGYFLYRRIAGLADLGRRVANLYYPYLLYSYLTAAIVMALAGKAHGEVTPRDVALIPLVPIQHYWFILFLIIAMAMALLVRRHVEVALAVMLLIAIVAAPLLPWANEGAYGIGKVAYWLAFFFTGSVLRKHGLLPQVSTVWAAVALVVSLAGVAASLTTGFYIREPAMFAVCLAMCYVLYCAGTWLDRPVLARLGALSLVIYLTHVIFGAGARVVLAHLWPGMPVALMLAVTILAAVGGPLVLGQVVARLGLSRLLGFTPLLAEPRADAAAQPAR